MRRRIAIFLVAVLALPAVLCACSEYSGTEEKTQFYGGDPLSPEDVQNMIDSVAAEQTEKYPIETDEYGECVVFWTDGGTVWHVSCQCPNVKRATAVHEGSEDDALAAGKQRPCSICSQN